MTTFAPPQATCRIRVFKAGVLSAVGHDLEFDLPRFSITVEDDAITGSFDGTSLVVRGALRDGRLTTSGLKDKDKREILANIQKRVFGRHRPAEIAFSCEDFERTEDGLEGTGTLIIPPHRHDVDFDVEVDGGRGTCVLRLHQPDWGIIPFKAPLGVLKVQPDVEVHIEVPWPPDLA